MTWAAAGIVAVVLAIAWFVDEPGEDAERGLP